MKSVIGSFPQLAVAASLWLILALLSVPPAEAFVVSSPLNINRYTATPRHPTTILHQGSDDAEGLSEPEQTVYDILQDMHDSNLPFRLVVVGNGAILETTSLLGPTFKLGKSPRTGDHLTTFASEDQSFEFHLMIAQVAKIVLTDKREDKVMQIFRFLTDEGKPMCSLILADKSEKAQKWFNSMVEKHGHDIQL